MRKKLSYIELENILKQTQSELEVREEEFNKIRSSFYSNVSHEIRTPMNAIVGFSQLLSDPGYSSNEKKFFADEINNNSKKLLHLIENMIVTAKYESDQIIIHKSFCNLDDLMEKIYHHFNDELKKEQYKKIELKFVKKTKNNHNVLFTDQKILEQIMTNLLENAFKFSANCTVQFGFEVNDDNTIRFFVNNSENGSKGKDLSNRSDRFNRLTRNYNFEDVKLGFSISEKLVKLLDGKLKVKSILGRGSSFYFTIPLLEKKPV
jgi:K+-sensing histidine kinase KdpD